MNTTTIRHWAWSLIVLLIFTACCKKNEPAPEQEHYEFDFSPIYLHVEVEDESGRDLVDPKHPHTITKQAVNIVVKGQSFELSDKPIRKELRYYAPQWYGYIMRLPESRVSLGGSLSVSLTELRRELGTSY